MWTFLLLWIISSSFSMFKYITFAFLHYIQKQKIRSFQKLFTIAFKNFCEFKLNIFFFVKNWLKLKRCKTEICAIKIKFFFFFYENDDVSCDFFFLPFKLTKVWMSSKIGFIFWNILKICWGFFKMFCLIFSFKNMNIWILGEPQQQRGT